MSSQKPARQEIHADIPTSIGPNVPASASNQAARDYVRSALEAGGYIQPSNSAQTPIKEVAPHKTSPAANPSVIAGRVLPRKKNPIRIMAKKFPAPTKSTPPDEKKSRSGRPPRLAEVNTSLADLANQEVTDTEPLPVRLVEDQGKNIIRPDIFEGNWSDFYPSIFKETVSSSDEIVTGAVYQVLKAVGTIVPLALTEALEKSNVSRRAVQEQWAAELASHQETISTLQNELSKTELTSAIQRGSSAIMQDAHAKLQTAEKKLRMELRAKEAELASLDVKISLHGQGNQQAEEKMQKELSDRREGEDELMYALVDEKLSNSFLRSELDRVTEDYLDVTEDVDNAVVEIESLKRRCRALEEEVAARNLIPGDLNAHEALQIATFENQRLQNIITILQNEVARVTTALAEAEKKVQERSEAEAENMRLMGVVGDLTFKLQEQTESCKSLEQRLSKTYSEIEVSGRPTEEVRYLLRAREVQDLTSEVVRLRNTVGHQDAELSKQTLDIASLKAQVSHRDQQLGDKDTIILGLRGTITALSSRPKPSEALQAVGLVYRTADSAENNGFRELVQEHKRVVREREEILKNQNVIIEKLQAEVSQLKERLAEWTVIASAERAGKLNLVPEKDHTKCHVELKKTNEILRANSEIYIKEIADLRQREKLMSELTSKNVSQAAAIADLSAQQKKIEAENRALREELEKVVAGRTEMATAFTAKSEAMLKEQKDLKIQALKLAKDLEFRCRTSVPVAVHIRANKAHLKAEGNILELTVENQRLAADNQTLRQQLGSLQSSQGTEGEECKAAITEEERLSDDNTMLRQEVACRGERIIELQKINKLLTDEHCKVRDRFEIVMVELTQAKTANRELTSKMASLQRRTEHLQIGRAHV